MRITTIINGKGGVGKTTTAQALAAGMNRIPNGKYKTLAIDYDPQGNLSFAYGADITNAPTMYHVINGEASIDEAIQHTDQGDIVAANASLTKIDSLFSGDEIFEGLDKLKDQLIPISDRYSHAFIDNQPLIGGMLTRQALVAATDLVVPMLADMFTIQGLARLEKAVETIQKRDNPNLKIEGLLLTKHNPRTIFGSNIGEAIEKWAFNHQTRVYQNFIRESVCVKESQAKKQSLFEYAPNSNPAIDYTAFIREYLNQESEG